MLRRLRVYFTGFAIGLIMVYFFFGRDDSRDLDIWTPSQRILEDIRNDSVFHESERLICYTDCLDISEDDLISIWKDSEVTSLNPGGDPYRYQIDLVTANRSYEAIVERIDKKHSLVGISDKQNPQSCEC
ncbi:MAG: hypothetical protein HN542_11245 [Flavobacteriales bacterium]|jgi:hypothetical protein|nr:hypothetical protein [Flavobacteriales bacterium]NCG30475.1 hypothetical protein [Bacteroidota bacterium]MBT4704766.1 hypothetical protein [Flavobacteriales bacterium]MBT4931651.1 hypothetical protein [Flavobacteriales bacterium]MBT5133617.1 hypothetical protein [Flavobacteriales bacterium]